MASPMSQESESIASKALERRAAPDFLYAPSAQAVDSAPKDEASKTGPTPALAAGSRLVPAQIGEDNRKATDAKEVKDTWAQKTTGAALKVIGTGKALKTSMYAPHKSGPPAANSAAKAYTNAQNNTQIVLVYAEMVAEDLEFWESELKELIRVESQAVWSQK